MTPVATCPYAGHQHSFLFIINPTRHPSTRCRPPPRASSFLFQESKGPSRCLSKVPPVAASGPQSDCAVVSPASRPLCCLSLSQSCTTSIDMRVAPLDVAGHSVLLNARASHPHPASHISRSLTSSRRPLEGQKIGGLPRNMANGQIKTAASDRATSSQPVLLKPQHAGHGPLLFDIAALSLC